jgi:hypothetical protein
VTKGFSDVAAQWLYKVDGDDGSRVAQVPREVPLTKSNFRRLATGEFMTLVKNVMRIQRFLYENGPGMYQFEGVERPREIRARTITNLTDQLSEAMSLLADDYEILSKGKKRKGGGGAGFGGPRGMSGTLQTFLAQLPARGVFGQEARFEALREMFLQVVDGGKIAMKLLTSILSYYLDVTDAKGNAISFDGSYEVAGNKFYNASRDGDLLSVFTADIFQAAQDKARRDAQDKRPYNGSGVRVTAAYEKREGTSAVPAAATIPAGKAGGVVEFLVSPSSLMVTTLQQLTNNPGVTTPTAASDKLSDPEKDAYKAVVLERVSPLKAALDGVKPKKVSASDRMRVAGSVYDAAIILYNEYAVETTLGLYVRLDALLYAFKAYKVLVGA